MMERVDEAAEPQDEEPRPGLEEAFGEAAEGRERLDGILESLLFAAGAPVALKRLVEIVNGPSVREIKVALGRLMDEYARAGRGIRLVAVAGGYQFRTAAENAEWVRALLRERPVRLGRAALETLAIIAYRQPVTRADVEAVRGVDADSALSSLLAKRLIKIAGRRETVGRPLVYATTPEFLEIFGLKDLAELPVLKEIGPAPESEDDAAIDDGEDGEWPAPAEDPESGGGQLAAQGRGADPGGPGAGERPGRAGARDEGAAERPDHD
jgi:segregation and condensation protein B